MEANEEAPVVVVILRAHGPYMPQDVAGFPPAVATALIGRGIAKLYGAEAVPAPEQAAAPVDQPPAPPAPEVDASAVVIPEDWETLHHFPLIKLAKQIVPSEEGITKDRAVEIIKTELDRRSAADL